jgi:hypothetical protein
MGLWRGREIIDTGIAYPVFWVHIEAPEYEQADDAEESLLRKFQRKVCRQRHLMMKSLTTSNRK